MTSSSHLIHLFLPSLPPHSRGGNAGGAQPPPAAGGAAGPRPLPSWLAPGSQLGNVNEQLSRHVRPFAIAGFMVQPIYLLIVGLAAALFGLRGALVAGIFVAVAAGQQ